MTQALNNPARASALLAELFGGAVAGFELREPADPGTLLPEEAGTCEAFHPKRLAEFAAGRLCARRALAHFGFDGYPLRRNADRSPRWPEPVVGSITHTVGFCGAVAALRTKYASLGVDAEIIARMTADLWAHVFTRGELAEFATYAGVQRERIAALAFSAKEAFYKCQYGITGRWLDYRNVSIEVTQERSDAGTFGIKPATANGRWIVRGLNARGRYRFDGALVATGIALTADESRSLAGRTPLAAV